MRGTYLFRVPGLGVLVMSTDDPRCTDPYPYGGGFEGDLKGGGYSTSLEKNSFGDGEGGNGCGSGGKR